MKQWIYLAGLINSFLVFIGIIFKVNHWPGAGIMLTLGIAILVIATIPLMLIDNYKKDGTRQNRILYIATWITSFVVFSAMLFKIQHWPLTGALATIGIPFPFVVFLPVFLVVTTRMKNFNVLNMVFVLLLLALSSVFTGLLAMN